MNSSPISKNIVTSILQQIVSVVSAFVLPRLILEAFGSAYNGIVNSVSQFLSCVALLRAGIGGVTRSALYRSLAENDTEKTSAIVKATELFMRKIALIFCVLLAVFAVAYPFFVKDEFEWFFSFSLVLILGVSTVIQYYFGITYYILLHADQRLYVYNIWQIIATVANTLLSAMLILGGFGIHAAKLGSAVAFSITPIVMHHYVRKRYSLQKDIVPDNTTITQRWDAFAHQLAAFIHSNTDVIVLTIFTDLLQVSVYSVYNAIVAGINQMIAAAANAVEALLGKVIASKDSMLLREKVMSYEWIMHTISVILFGCTGVLIVPFVMVYTSGIADVDYNQPEMGYLMCLAYWMSAIRMPYQNIIEAAGHFRQTKKIAITEAALNIGLSCVLVILVGTIGVMVGTVVAMTYRTVCYAFYAQRYILKETFLRFIKRVLVSVFVLSAIIVPFILFDLEHFLVSSIENYSEWLVSAVCVFLIVSLVTFAVNYLFYPQETRRNINRLLKRL